jgi:hypothetical protein
VVPDWLGCGLMALEIQNSTDNLANGKVEKCPQEYGFSERSHGQRVDQSLEVESIDQSGRWKRRGGERGAVGKVRKRPSVLDQFVEYLRDHLLLDRSVDGKHFYNGKFLSGCLEAWKPICAD